MAWIGAVRSFPDLSFRRDVENPKMIFGFFFASEIEVLGQVLSHICSANNGVLLLKCLVVLG